MNKLFRVVGSVVVGLAIGVSGAGASRPEAKWRRIGKSAHSRMRMKSVKARNTACATTCRKAGARKATDLGACKEGCVFG